MVKNIERDLDSCSILDECMFGSGDWNSIINHGSNIYREYEKFIHLYNPWLLQKREKVVQKNNHWQSSSHLQTLYLL